MDPGFHNDGEHAHGRLDAGADLGHTIAATPAVTMMAASTGQKRDRSDGRVAGATGAAVVAAETAGSCSSNGDHTNKVGERIERNVLPFFSKNLAAPANPTSPSPQP